MYLGMDGDKFGDAFLRVLLVLDACPEPDVRPRPSLVWRHKWNGCIMPAPFLTALKARRREMIGDSLGSFRQYLICQMRRPPDDLPCLIAPSVCFLDEEVRYGAGEYEFPIYSIRAMML